MTFTISSIAVAVYFYKFSLRGLDTPGIIILSTYLIKNAFCIIVGEDLYQGSDYITPVASTVIFAVLLYFVIEMSYIRVAIEE